MARPALCYLCLPVSPWVGSGVMQEGATVVRGVEDRPVTATPVVR